MPAFITNWMYKCFRCLITCCFGSADNFLDDNVDEFVYITENSVRVIRENKEWGVFLAETPDIVPEVSNHV